MLIGVSIGPPLAGGAGREAGGGDLVDKAVAAREVNFIASPHTSSTCILHLCTYRSHMLEMHVSSSLLPALAAPQPCTPG